jgi:hypothetical protein
MPIDIEWNMCLTSPFVVTERGRLLFWGDPCMTVHSVSPLEEIIEREASHILRCTRNRQTGEYGSDSEEQYRDNDFQWGTPGVSVDGIPSCITAARLLGGRCAVQA